MSLKKIKIKVTTVLTSFTLSHEIQNYMRPARFLLLTVAKQWSTSVFLLNWPIVLLNIKTSSVSPLTGQKYLTRGFRPFMWVIWEVHIYRWLLYLSYRAKQYWKHLLQVSELKNLTFQGRLRWCAVLCQSHCSCCPLAHRIFFRPLHCCSWAHLEFGNDSISRISTEKNQLGQVKIMIKNVFVEYFECVFTLS